MTWKRRDGGGKRRGTSSQPASLEAIMEVLQEGPGGAHDSVAGTGAPGLHTRLHRSFQQACRGLAAHVRGCASEGGSSF